MRKVIGVSAAIGAKVSPLRVIEEAPAEDIKITDDRFNLKAATTAGSVPPISTVDTITGDSNEGVIVAIRIRRAQPAGCFPIRLINHKAV